MIKVIRALIVDDEELARIGLRLMLEKFPSVEIVGEAFDIKSASEAIKNLKPEVIFLDIEFPGESGFDLLEQIDSSVKIIFVTAFDEFAIQAFEVNACDYLLKPISQKRLEKAIQRLEAGEINTQSPGTGFNYNDKIFLAINYKYHFIQVNSVVRISSAGKYSEVLTTGKIKGLVKKSLHEWENCLPKKHFLRIHRSTIVNIEYIEKIEKNSNSTFTVYIKGTGEKYLISRRFATQLRKQELLNHL